MSAFYISIGLAFSGFVWWQMTPEATAAYLTALRLRHKVEVNRALVVETRER